MILGVHCTMVLTMSVMAVHHCKMVETMSVIKGQCVTLHTFEELYTPLKNSFAWFLKSSAFALSSRETRSTEDIVENTVDPHDRSCTRGLRGQNFLATWVLYQARDLRQHRKILP